jgi:hypothetical protein
MMIVVENYRQGCQGINVVPVIPTPSSHEIDFITLSLNDDDYDYDDKDDDVGNEERPI